MRAVIRTDASAAIGTGHVTRCLALADALRADGWRVAFACRPHVGHMGAAIAAAGFELAWLAPPRAVAGPRPEDGWAGATEADDAAETRALVPGARLVVRDHYALGVVWDRTVGASRLLAIDDLADRAQSPDALVDATCLDGGARYDALLPKACARFLGPEQAVLRLRLTKLSADRQTRREPPRLLVFMGGIDASAQCARVAWLLAPWAARTAAIDLTLGAGHLAPNAVVRAAGGLARARVHRPPYDFDALMARADAMIGAGGTNLWERALLGLPSLSIAVADNQERVVAEAGAAGLTIAAGRDRDTADTEFGAAIGAFLADSTGRAAMAERCRLRMASRIGGGALSPALAAWIGAAA